MQRLIYSLFIVIFKASICCQKKLNVDLILKNKLILNKIKYILLIISAQERLGVVSKQKGNISVSAKNI